MILNRDLLKIILSDTKPNSTDLITYKNTLIDKYQLTLNEASYFVFKGKIKNQGYNKLSEPIRILKKDKTVEDIVDAPDQLQLKALSKSEIKYFICFPKTLLDL
jgi:hypothetical protein